MIAARIGHDHFVVWRIPEAQAAALVPGLAPVVSGGWAWLVCAVAEFRSWRLYGFPGIGCLRTAAWLVPCVLADGRIGNAFVSRFVDHAWLPHGWSIGGWRHANIRISADDLLIGGQVSAHANGAAPADALAWFDADRCGLLRQVSGWSRWPIAKCDWGWSFRAAEIRSAVAKRWHAQPFGVITVNRTVAVWGMPTALR